MTLEKDDLGSSTPLHVHVDDETPVHVHVKKPKKSIGAKAVEVSIITMIFKWKSICNISIGVFW